MYNVKSNTGKGNNNSLEPDIALQTSVMPRRSPGVLRGWRQRTDGSEGRCQVCGSHSYSPQKVRTEDSREAENLKLSGEDSGTAAVTRLCNGLACL